MRPRGSRPALRGRRRDVGAAHQTNGLLDRGHGKAVQHIEADVNVYDSLSFDEKEGLLAVLESLDVLAGDEEGDSGGPVPTHH